MLTSVTGINWGDEGKGRIVDLLSRKGGRMLSVIREAIMPGIR